MNISIKTIPHNEQRYETVGDWTFDEKGDLIISVSDMNNWKFEALVAVHELIEVLLCKDRNIKDEDVTAFDKKFEEMRKQYPEILGDDEPGNHHKAPYFQEHLAASQVERHLAAELKVDWEQYDKQVSALPEILTEQKNG